VNRLDLLTQWAYRLNKEAPSSMDATTQARAIGFFNQRQRRLLTLPGLRHLREATITVTSVADQPNYVLANVAKITRMFETTNDRTLYEMSQQDYRFLQPDTTITGTPEAFIWTGRQEVAKQPSDASSLFVKSSSASDTTQTVYVEGVITGNYPVSASVTLTGTTAVDISSATTTWERVDKFYLSAVAVGAVTLHEDSGSGTELAKIAIGQTTTDYAGFSLYMTPSAVITYYVDITRAVTDLAQSTDVPVLPEDFHDVLLLGAVMDEYQHLNDPRYSVAAMEYKQRVGELQYWLAETGTGQPFSLTRGWQKPSQLGSWYPAGT
jgi:hypothetical protein